MHRLRSRVLSALGAVGLVGSLATALPAPAGDCSGQHVLLLSVGGLHQSDLAWYVAHHPGSGLAVLVHRGVEFTNAQTPFPSIGVPAGDARVPDVIGIARYGTVYIGGHGKIAEHGGDNPQDRDVALVVSGPSVDGGTVNESSVETTQIAPTILELLGLNPGSLQAVQVEHTQVVAGPSSHHLDRR